jgi:hypothetical protein
MVCLGYGSWYWKFWFTWYLDICSFLIYLPNYVSNVDSFLYLIKWLILKASNYFGLILPVLELSKWFVAIKIIGINKIVLNLDLYFSLIYVNLVYKSHAMWMHFYPPKILIWTICKVPF